MYSQFTWKEKESRYSYSIQIYTWIMMYVHAIKNTDAIVAPYEIHEIICCPYKGIIRHISWVSTGYWLLFLLDIIFNPYWTGRTYVSLCCNIMVASLWCHLEHHKLGGVKTILHCGQRDMCSWSMVNNEENWLPWQIKDWFNKNKNKVRKRCSVPGTGKMSSPQFPKC